MLSKFFTGPREVAAQLEKMTDSMNAMAETMTKLIDQQAASLHANTSRIDALANRLGNVEHHLEAMRGGMNSRSEAK